MVDTVEGILTVLDAATTEQALDLRNIDCTRSRAIGRDSGPSRYERTGE